MMSDQTHFSATEARQNFFDILRMASKGKTIEIEKMDDNIQFELKKKTTTTKQEKMRIIKAMAKINARVPHSQKKLKQIIIQSKQIDLSL